jgi:hypothetical protein
MKVANGSKDKVATRKIVRMCKQARRALSADRVVVLFLG